MATQRFQSGSRLLRRRLPNATKELKGNEDSRIAVELAPRTLWWQRRPQLAGRQDRGASPKLVARVGAMLGSAETAPRPCAGNAGSRPSLWPHGARTVASRNRVMTALQAPKSAQPPWFKHAGFAGFFLSCCITAAPAILAHLPVFYPVGHGRTAIVLVKNKQVCPDTENGFRDFQISRRYIHATTG